MANVSFKNLHAGFRLASYTQLVMDTYETTIYAGDAGDSRFRIEGSDFEYGTYSIPTSGQVNKVSVDLNNDNGANPDILFTGVDLPFSTFQHVHQNSTPYARGNYFWEAALSGGDTIDFGTNASPESFAIEFAGDGYDTKSVSYGGNDTIRGDVGTGGSVSGDFSQVFTGTILFAGNDDIRLIKSLDSEAVGDAIYVYSNTQLYAGDDRIQLASRGTAKGDAYSVAGTMRGGDDTLFGSAQDDSLFGDASRADSGSVVQGGNDEIHAGGGKDLLVGDMLTVNDSAQVRGGNDKLYGDDGNDTIQGNGGNDNLDGGTGADSLEGGDGNDFLRGGTGNDFIQGNDGTDTVSYSERTTKVTLSIGGAGNGAASIGGESDTLRSIENAVGGSAGDDFSGFYLNGNNRFEGNGGNDTISAGGGNDTVLGGAGNDSVLGATGDDSLDGGDNNDVLFGGAGKDKINGGSGVDRADYSDKTTKIEIVFGSAATTTVKVNGAAEDTLTSIEYIVGGGASDLITGFTAAVNNLFDGRNGNDILKGGGGLDTLLGGAGKDTLTGGDHADQFRFSTAPSAGNVDTILDFKAGLDDMAFSKSAYAALGASVTQDEVLIRASGNAAANANQHIIYDKQTGRVWWDVDGLGGTGPVQVAQLGTTATHPTNLTWQDFIVL